MPRWRSQLLTGRPFSRWIDLGGFLCTCAYVWLAVLSRGQADVDLRLFFAILGIAWAGTLIAYRAAQNPRHAPQDRSFIRRMLFWSLLFRIVAFFGEPVLDDDYYRYLWDGRSFAATGNPYRNAPIDDFDDDDLPLRFQTILDNINHPHVPTIYGPTNQYLFLLSYWVAPGQLFPVKLALLTADVLTICILLKLTKTVHVLLYAWCPLLIHETGFSAHLDTLGVFFLAAALTAGLKERYTSASVFSALAVGTKIFAVLFLPFLLSRLGRRHQGMFVLALLCLYAPFWLQGSSADWTAAMTFARDWEFNSSAYALLSLWLGSQSAKAASLLLYGTFYALYWLRYRAQHLGEIPRGDVLYGLFFLLSPVANPWYLLWLLPFAALRPSCWAIMALASVSLSYAYGLNLPAQHVVAGYNHPGWVRPVEFGLIGLSILYDRFGKSRLPGKTG